MQQLNTPVLLVFSFSQAEFTNQLPLPPYLLRSLHCRILLGCHKTETASSYFFCLIITLYIWNNWLECYTLGEQKSLKICVPDTWRGAVTICPPSSQPNPSFWLTWSCGRNEWTGGSVGGHSQCDVTNMWHRVRGSYVSIGRHWYSIQWSEKEVLPLYILKTATEQSKFCLFSTWIELYFYLRIFGLEL